jgi:CheY-like chemotaxis protein
MEMRKNNPSVPVIAISGGGFNSPQDYLSIACAAGAKAVLEKPVERAVLLSAVKTILEEKHEK